MYVSEICAVGIFVTFPWWLKNVKNRSKIAPFSNEHHLEIWFPKKKTIMFFWSKLSKLHKKRPNFACDNYIFPKTRGNKNKQCTHSTPLKTRRSRLSTFQITVFIRLAQGVVGTIWLDLEALKQGYTLCSHHAAGSC